MWKNNFIIFILGLFLLSCFPGSSIFSFLKSIPIEVLIYQDKEFPVKNFNEINLQKKPFDIVIRFNRNLDDKMYFVQFSQSDHFYKGLGDHKSIGDVLSVIYPDMDRSLLTQAFLSGGMSGATDPANNSNLFFTSDYSNIWMYYKDGSHYCFNSVELKPDYIEARYRIENFDGGEGIKAMKDYPYDELYISFVYPESGADDYDKELTKSVKIMF